MSIVNKSLLFAVAVLSAPILAVQSSSAEGVFVDQIQINDCNHCQHTPAGLTKQPKNDDRRAGGSMYTAQYGNKNIAAGFDFGLRNSINQIQIGNRNSSVVGLRANDTRVDVVQLGNDLKSNLAINGTPRFNISVFQTPNSPPVNASITTRPNGQTIIRPGANAQVRISGLGQ